MATSSYKPWVYRFSMATALVALLPIGVGALVTTMNWGMAFPDWPTSDGQNMILYPWWGTLHSAMDKFAEHGHRLAGMVIGLFSIALCGLLWWKESRLFVRLLGTAVLLSVIAQGLLGGFRVIADERQAALVHGAFAACVFTLICAVTQLTSRGWLNATPGKIPTQVGALKPLSILLPLLVFGQYVLGGQLRHLGRGLHEHLGFAFLVVAATVATVILAHRTKNSWLRKTAWMMVALLFVQVGLGLASWVTKFGWPQAGYVAVQHSPLQVIVRTSHTVVGMLVFMTSVLLAMRTLRISSFCTSSVNGVQETVGSLQATKTAIPGGMA